MFTASGKFKAAIEKLADQARKALFKFKTYNLQSNVLTAMKLLEILVLPILLYCSDIYSPFYFVNPNEHNLLATCDKLPSEKILLNFGKYLLGVHKKVTNAAVRGN